MTTRTYGLLALGAAALLCAAPLAAQDPGKTTEGSFELGAYGTSVTASPEKAMEYEPTGTYVPYRLLLSSHESWGSLELRSEKTAGDDQKHLLTFDAQRSVRVKAWLDEFGHREPHDPMTNLTAAVADGKYVWNTDLAPGTEYKISYSRMGGRAELQLPGLSAVTLGLGYREQWRQGHVQAMTLSHCESCHVTSQTRAIDEKTRDASADLTYAFGGGSVKATYNHRELTNGDPYALLTYDRALHPVQHTPIFDNRLQYDATEGPQKVDYRPDVRKNSGTLEISLNDLGGFAVGGVGVLSTTQNRYSGLEASYGGGLLALTRAWKSGLRLRWRARYTSMSSDDVFVDSTERTSVAGPQAGKTYRQVYGYDPDFLRQSVLDRNVYESSLELSQRLGRKLGTLRAVWTIDAEDRTHYEVTPGEKTSTTNVLGLSWRSQASRGLRLWADYRHGNVANPFLAQNTTCSQLEYPKSGTSALDPTLAQYYMSHAARVGDPTAYPSNWDEAKAGVTWLKGGTGLTATYRYWTGSNKSGDKTDWSRTNHSAAVTLWATPSPAWNLYAGYSFQKSEMGTPTCVSLFDG